MKTIITSKITWIALLTGGVLVGLGWWQKGPILSWYYIRQLSYAYPENREECAMQMASLDEEAVPHVLAGLSNGDTLVCANMKAVLEILAQKWGMSDPRSTRLVEDLHARFQQFSPAGQEKALLFLTGFLQQEGSRPVPSTISKCLGELVVSGEKNPELRAVSLLLAAELIDSVQPGQWVDECREMAGRGLVDEKKNTRVAAMEVLLRDPLRKDNDMLAKVVPLLHDKEPAVRKVALFALAAENKLAREEALMPLLHDDDSEVRYVCELVLRRRGLTDEEIKLARMISDPSPAVRLRVLHQLPQTADLNLAEWLWQLSQDPSPAVRAAAVRAAGENAAVDLTPRLREMAEQDPSETVRMNAHYYLHHRVASRRPDDR